MAEARCGSQDTSEARGTRSPVSTPPSGSTAASSLAEFVPSWKQRFPDGVSQGDDLEVRQAYILLRLRDVQEEMAVSRRRLMGDGRWLSTDNNVLSALKFQMNAVAGMFRAEMRSVEVESKMLGVDKISERATSDDPAEKVKKAITKFAQEEAEVEG